jgi:hypothetical protein
VFIRPKYSTPAATWQEIDDVLYFQTVSPAFQQDNAQGLWVIQQPVSQMEMKIVFGNPNDPTDQKEYVFDLFYNSPY